MDEVLELLQCRDGLLQVGLLVLHLDDLGRQVLVCRHELLVLVFILIDFLLVVRGKQPLVRVIIVIIVVIIVIIIDGIEEAFLELLLAFHLVHEHLHLTLHGLPLQIPLPLLIITHLWVPTGPLIHLSLQFCHLHLIFLLHCLNLLQFVLLGPVNLIRQLLDFLPATV